MNDMTLSERVEQFKEEYPMLGIKALNLIHDCQAQISQLTSQRDAAQKRFEVADDNAAMWGCENSELKERLAQAEALLRRASLSSAPYGRDIAMYFKEKL